MVYTVENTSEVGRLVEKIVDANGFVVNGRTIRCDTETGELERFKEDKSGQLVVKDGEVERETLWLTPPLLVVFKEIK